MAVNYYSAKSGDWDSPIWTMNPNDKNAKLIKLPETLSNEDRLIVRHHIKNNQKLVDLGYKIKAPISVELGAKLEIQGTLRLKDYYLSNECKVEIQENLYLDGNSNICGNGDLVVGGGINKSEESFICSNIPVELDYFNANYSDDGIKIEWYSASLIEDLTFELEKSTDGINFEAILDNKNSSESNSRKFSLKDKNLNNETELVYYRLKQMDNSGRHNYSYIIFTDLNKISSANLEYSNQENNYKLTSLD
jgi:hypothetical protein